MRYVQLYACRECGHIVTQEDIEALQPDQVMACPNHPDAIIDTVMIEHASITEDELNFLA